jgi:preprotein translocase subunit SecE
MKAVAKQHPRQQGRVSAEARGRALGSFFRDVRSELRKVTWPSREEARNLTVVVIAVSAAVGFFLGGIDFVFSALIRLLLQAG